MKNSIVLKRIICILIVFCSICSFSCGRDNQGGDSGKNSPKPTSEAPAGETVKPVATPGLPTENGTLKLSFSKYSSLNPLVTDNRDVVTFMGLVLEPLFGTSLLMEPVKVLAEDYVCDESFKVWEVSIKPGIVFSDGTELKPGDVKATFDYILENGGNYAENVENIVRVFEKDEKTVQFLLEKPDAHFLGKLNVPISSAGSCGKNNPIGTGLFKTEMVSEATVLLVLNDTYRDKNVKPHISTVEINVFKNEYEKMKSDFDICFIYGQNVTEYVLSGTRQVGYFTGDIYNYIAFNTTPTYMESEATTKKVEVVTVDETGAEIREIKEVEDRKYISFPNPFENAELRRAVNYMISRETVVNAAGAGNGTISLLPAYTGTVYRSQLNADYENNVFKAEECIRSCGYTKNEDGLWFDAQGRPLTVKLLTIANNNKLCSIMRITRNVLEQCGIAVEYEAVSAEEYKRKLEEKEFMLAAVEIALPAWTDVSQIFGSEGKLNFSKWQNTKIDSYIEQLAAIADYSVYNAAFERIEREVLAENPIAGLYVSSTAVVTGKRIGGVVTENFHIWNLLEDFPNWYITEEK